MTRLEERIRTGLQETAERIPDTAPIREARLLGSTRTGGVWVAVAAIVGVFVLFTPILFLRGSDPDTTPIANPSQFGGEWVTDQSDDSTHTMTIEVSGAGSAAMNAEDDFASVCSGAPFQVIGTGSFQTNGTLVFSSPNLTCKDGSPPEAVSGPPLEERFRQLTFTYDPGSDTLTDSIGLLWTRGIPNTPGIHWPQTNLEEVQEAQELADAGDPDYTWQLEPSMESILQGESHADTPEIFARFLQKELGWEEFALIGSSDTFEYGGFQAVGAQLIRCEPGKANPVWPTHPRFGGCAPTIDDLHYESVIIHVTQPGRQGPEGIWVASFLTEAEPIEQAPQITGVGVEEMMEAFIQARIAGEGAEEYLGDTDPQHLETGFLYATSTGAPYERAEFEVEDEIGDLGPLGGSIGLRVRLFAEEGQTVVEQTFSLELDRSDRRWALYHHQNDQNTENGVPLPNASPEDN